MEEFFILSKEGIKLLHVNLKTLHGVRGIGKNSLEFLLKLDVQKLKKMWDSISLCKINLNKNSNFCFHITHLAQTKICFLFEKDHAFIGTFSQNANKYYIKLIILHLYCSFNNFNQNSFSTKHSTKNKKSDNINKNIQELPLEVDNLSQLDFHPNKFIQYKIYEQFFVRYFIQHFHNVFNFIIKKEGIYINEYKFKNMYALDLSSGEIIFDLQSAGGSKKFKKFYKNKKLWEEIIHQSNQLMRRYTSENMKAYTDKDSRFRFVRIECTSTFPRLTFIIKFLPILRGVSLIHVYSQKKLSRPKDIGVSGPKIDNRNRYRETDFLYGADIIINSSIELKYVETKKLQEIEIFLLEFFMSVCTDIKGEQDLFFDSNHILKYTDFSLIRSIKEFLKEKSNEAELKLEQNFESLITAIGNDLNRNYFKEEHANEDEYKIDNEIKRDPNNLYNFLQIKKENIFHALFADKILLCNSAAISEIIRNQDLIIDESVSTFNFQDISDFIFNSAKANRIKFSSSQNCMNLVVNSVKSNRLKGESLLEINTYRSNRSNRELMLNISKINGKDPNNNCGKLPSNKSLIESSFDLSSKVSFINISEQNDSEMKSILDKRRHNKSKSTVIKASDIIPNQLNDLRVPQKDFKNKHLNIYSEIEFDNMQQNDIIDKEIKSSKDKFRKLPQIRSNIELNGVGNENKFFSDNKPKTMKPNSIKNQKLGFLDKVREDIPVISYLNSTLPHNNVISIACKIKDLSISKSYKPKENKPGRETLKLNELIMPKDKIVGNVDNIDKSNILSFLIHTLDVIKSDQEILYNLSMEKMKDTNTNSLCKNINSAQQCDNYN